MSSASSALPSDLWAAYGKAIHAAQLAENALEDTLLWAIYVAELRDIEINGDLLRLIANSPWISVGNFLLSQDKQAFVTFIAKVLHPLEPADLVSLGRQITWLTRGYLTNLDKVVGDSIGLQGKLQELRDVEKHFQLIVNHLRNQARTAAAALGLDDMIPRAELRQQFDKLKSAAQGRDELQRGPISDQLALLLNLAQTSHSDGDLNRSTALYHRALVWAKRSNSPVATIRSCIGLGHLSRSRNAPADARQWFLVAREELKIMDHTQGMAFVDYWLGVVARDQQKFVEAESLFQQALESQLLLGNKQGALRPMLQLAWLASATSRYEGALEIYHAMLELEPDADDATKAEAYGGIASAHLQLAQYNEAASWCERAIKLLEQMGDVASLGWACFQRGLVAQRLGYLKGAHDWYKKSLKFVERSGKRGLEASCYLHLAQVSQQWDHVEDALAYYRSALELFAKLGDQEGIAFASQSITEILRISDVGAAESLERADLKTLKANPAATTSLSSDESGTPVSVDRTAHVLSRGEQLEVISRLPLELQKLQATEVVHLDLRFRLVGNKDSVAEFFIVQRPDPISAPLVHSSLGNLAADQLLAVGLFPSGAVRTVGEIIVVDGQAAIYPFDYWSLIDPDAECEDAEFSARVELRLIGIGLL